jgi:hypothetical protein
MDWESELFVGTNPRSPKWRKMAKEAGKARKPMKSRGCAELNEPGGKSQFTSFLRRVHQFQTKNQSQFTSFE